MDANDVSAYVRDRGLQAEVIRLTEHTPTVESAARVVGTSVDRIVKSVLFVLEASAGGAVLVIANGTSRVDYRRVADYLGVSRKRLRLADAEAVLAHTGYAVGGVPPFAHPTALRTLIDRRVLDQPEVYAGGGAVDALIRTTPQEIVRATNAEIVDVSS